MLLNLLHTDVHMRFMDAHARRDLSNVLKLDSAHNELRAIWQMKVASRRQDKSRPHFTTESTDKVEFYDDGLYSHDSRANPISLVGGVSKRPNITTCGKATRVGYFSRKLNDFTITVNFVYACFE